MHQLVTGTASGELKYIDFRMSSEASGKLGVYKTVQAHSKGSITALVGHPHSPLIASATTTQVNTCSSAHCSQFSCIVVSSQSS